MQSIQQTAAIAPVSDVKYWWNQLPVYWKTAFNEVFFRKGPVADMPDEAQLGQIFSTPALRFAGPRAPYPNMRSELPNLAGLEALTQLEILVVSHHNIVHLKGVERLAKLKSLFIHDNQIENLSGIERLTRLEELYFQNNKVRSLEPVRSLTNLKKLYCPHNEISSFEGITSKHSNNLKEFFGLPNDHIPQKEIIRLENRLGIRCRRG